MSVRHGVTLIIGLTLATVGCSSEHAANGSAPVSSSSIEFDVPYSIVQSYDRYAEADDPSVAAWHREVEPILAKHSVPQSGLVYWRDVAKDTGVASIAVIHGNQQGQCDFMLVATRVADRAKVAVDHSHNPAKCDALPTSTPMTKTVTTADGALDIVAVDWRSSNGDTDTALLADVRSLDGNAILAPADDN